MGAALPAAVWVLGLVALLMDLSSETIHCLLPAFLVSVLGASALSVGLIEGAAEAAALVVKVFSGWLSDRLGRRKPLVLAGYGLAALSKPLFPLAGSVSQVFIARFTDRLGKGLRGAPRDALLADITPDSLRGAAFGLRQALDTTGAFLGPLAALLLMSFFDGDYRAVFWFATVPAASAVLLLAVGVWEPPREPTRTPRASLRFSRLGELGDRYWHIVALGSLCTLARASEAFLVLKAREVGVDDSDLPIVFIVLNVVYAFASYPAGRLADRIDRRRLLAAGMASLAAADMFLASAHDGMLAMIGVAFWGLHMGLTQGVLSAMVAGTAPAGLRGTAFGFFHLCCGAATLAAGALTGLIWDRFGSRPAFHTGAILAIAALLLVLDQKAREPSRITSAS